MKITWSPSTAIFRCNCQKLHVHQINQIYLWIASAHDLFGFIIGAFSIKKNKLPTLEIRRIPKLKRAGLIEENGIPITLGCNQMRGVFAPVTRSCDNPTYYNPASTTMVWLLRFDFELVCCLVPVWGCKLYSCAIWNWGRFSRFNSLSHFNSSHLYESTQLLQKVFINR